MISLGVERAPSETLDPVVHRSSGPVLSPTVRPMVSRRVPGLAICMSTIGWLLCYIPGISSILGMQEGKFVEKENVIQRVSTGNSKLDSFLSGGFPRGSLILISGNPGTGKTIFTASFLYNGAMKENENGIYMSFCEGKRSFFENMNSLGLDFERLEKKGQFRFMEMFTTTKEGMATVTGDMLKSIKEFGAKRLVIDSYSVMAQALGGPYEGRQVLHTVLNKIVRNLGCTTLVIGEQPSGDTRIGDGAEEFVADGVINLKLTIPRELELRKMRGTMLKTRDLSYTIDNGFRVLTTDLTTPQSPKMWEPIPDSADRVSTGSS